MSTPKPTKAERIVGTAAVAEMEQRPERHREHDQRDADDEEQEERQPLHDLVGDVLECGRLAGDVRLGVPAGGRRRHDVVPEPVDQGVRLLVLRAESGVTKTIPTVPSSLICGSPTDATPASPRTPS